MIREDQFKTVTGQRAWIFYQQWMKNQRKMVPKARGFINSRFFNSFYRFAEYAVSVKIKDTQLFILVMVEKGIPPTIWTNSEVYAMYLEYFDASATPQQQADVSINTLFDLAEQYECDIGECFEKVPVNEYIQHIRARNLSPWILMFSSKFREMLSTRSTTEQQVIIETLIKPDYWIRKFQAAPDVVISMKRYVKEMGI